VVDAVFGALELQPGSGDEVVELGCGIGRLTRVLAQRVRSVRALDVSGEMLVRGAQLNPQLDNVEWLHCDGRSLTGVADASADGFFSHVVFQHVPSPEITYGYIREIGRVLRPGGWAAFQVSDNPEIHRRRGGAGGLASRLRAFAGRAPKGSAHPAWLGSAVDLGRLGEVARDAGLAVERVTGERTQFCFVALRR
jgi:ubiquinone/menaquinone biosynthesis C-methylase UbiE